jgi:hypothetical protein
MPKFAISFCLIAFIVGHSFSQTVDKVITLDSVTIEAVKRGFDVKDFIDWVQNDTTFYKAFKNLRYYPYNMESKLTVFDKSNTEKAMLQRQAVQKVIEGKRWIIIKEENVSGNIYKKNKEHKYYTAEMLDYIFYPKDTFPASNLLSDKSDFVHPDSKIEKNIEKLKILMFNPGAEVGGVPLIGNRMAIFDEKMTKHYEYKILTDTINDSIPCYIFSCKAKQVNEIETDDKAVIKNLSTWFDKRTLNVLRRAYTLTYSSIFFDFDVTMNIELQQIKGALVPITIQYNGNWDIPFRKPEIVNFNINFYNFDIQP